MGPKLMSAHAVHTLRHAAYTFCTAATKASPHFKLAESSRRTKVRCTADFVASMRDGQIADLVNTKTARLSLGGVRNSKEGSLPPLSRGGLPSMRSGT